MFLKTLSMSKRVESTVSQKFNKSPIIPNDQRGKHLNRPHKIQRKVFN